MILNNYNVAETLKTIALFMRPSETRRNTLHTRNGYDFFRLENYQDFPAMVSNCFHCLLQFVSTE
jgi:hypothetical protein